MRLLAIAVCLAVAGCSTQKGNERHAQHAEDQIRMVALQRESRVQEARADAEANTALVEALAEISRNSPESANAAVVALAVIGVRNQGSDDADAPVVTLQQQRNEALEWTKALAPTVGGLVTGLGMAAIQADVNKTQSDNAAKVQINDANSDVSIVQAVAGLGAAAASSVGIQAGGDIYQVSDSGAIDQSVNTSDSNNTTSTTTSTTTFSLSTTLNYDGSSMTLAELIEQLQGAGASYSIDLDGDGQPDVEGEGEGESLTINCDAAQFSPQPPECWGV